MVLAGAICRAADGVAYAAARLCPQSIAPQSTPRCPGTRFSSVPKACIRAAHDRTIPPEYQIEMTNNWCSTLVYDRQTLHLPFIANSEHLAAHPDTIAGRL